MMAHYHRSDPIKNLRIRVVVEKESSGKLRGQRKRSEKVSKEKFHRIDEVIKWQSKKFSPTEFARYSSADSVNVKLVKKIKAQVEHPDDDHASDSDDGDNSANTPSGNANGSTSVRHEHYIKLQNTKLKFLRQQLKNREVEPESVFRPVSLFTYIDRDGYVPKTRPLVDNKHHTATTPLAQALDNLSRRGHDDTEASGTRGHLERDMSFTSMHIMLAFSDTEEVLAAATNAPSPGTTDIESAATDEKSKAIMREELLLCSIQAFTGSNRVVISPPLNDNGTRRRKGDSDDTWHRCESKVTGDIYRYRITNESDISFRNNDELSLDLEIKEREGLARATEELVNEIGPYAWNGGLQYATEVLRLHAMVEIVSAHEFSALNALYVRYEVVLPDTKEWEWPADPNEDVNLHKKRDRRVLQSRHRIYKQGITQTVWPVIMKPRRPTSRSHPGVRNTSADDNAFGKQIPPENGFGLGRVREESVAHICMPIDLELVNVHHSQEARKALGHDEVNGVPVDMSKNDPTASDWPQIRLAVYSRTRTDQHQLLAYGYYNLPRTPGFSDDTVSMWKPQTTAWHRFSTFFLGGCLELEDKGFVNHLAPKQLAPNHRVASNFGLRTTSAGRLRIRSNVVIQRRPQRYERATGSAAPAYGGAGAPRHPAGRTGREGRNRKQLGTILEKLRQMKTARTGMSGRRLDTTLRDLTMTLADTMDQMKRAKSRLDGDEDGQR